MHCATDAASLAETSEIPEAALVRSLFANEVCAVAAAAGSEPPPLLPEEAACILRAVNKRRREFALGRACAREALEQLGIFGYPLLIGPDRAPVWPGGVVGSITHCDGFAGAAVAGRGLIRSIGLDAEAATPLDAEVVDLICTRKERAWIETAAPPPLADWPKIVFSAKEAVYKCLSPLYNSPPIDFLDVEIVPNPCDAEFTARPAGGRSWNCWEWRHIKGRYAFSPGYVLTGVTITERSEPQVG